ncbi:YidC/Oxa1 family insertase periplasmic-domain containing protein [Rariglobus hedericola]|uniref:Membrane protein insertase YidC n=1 Tax=Rariglobus hedericola TaxID=2597822 RepID=A0A556QJC0_9BACT|nr:YidC/Oxa1 family insertase periplasmic-domain containing protein [Rariglobus hedericola]TSJ76717.1 membrane protein insertase YidC [Rariglobus hedericola]
MDKKNTTIGVILLLVAFASLYFASPKPGAAPTATPDAVTPASTAAVEGQPAGTTPPTGTLSAPALPAPTNSTFAALANDNADASITTLANDYVELRLTDFGGAIRDVAFKKYAAIQGQPEPFVFNHLHASPILALDDFPGLDRSARYALVSATSTEVVYRAVLENRIEVTRRYVLRAPGDTTGDPYRIRHETTFRNLTDQTTPLPRAAVNLGTANLIDRNDTGQYLNLASYDGEDAHFTDRGALQGGGFLSGFGIGNKADLPSLELTQKTVWAGVKNQFFASIFTPEKPGVGVLVRRIELPALAGSSYPSIGLTGAARFDLPVLPAAGSASITGELYVGPKEYTRLDKLGNREDLVMQFSRGMGKIFLSGIVSPALNKLMKWTYGFVHNWGIAIILMTILLKVISLPFTLAASKSAKRMQKLQPLMQAVREKYKDQPQKLNQATMELFKEHKVNPAGGCIPILITIPLFIGFFTMLQGTAELRFQSFLWAHDLSAPDTVARIFGLPLNIMPLLMGVTMFFQMKLTPSPTTDNMQAKIFKFMPFFFTAICYNFSCALALYSTINGLFTIGQQLVVNKYTKTDPVPTPLGVPSGTGKGKKLKNVTPPKKK